MTTNRTGIEKLRAMVEFFNACREDFLDPYLGKPYSLEELLRIYDYSRVHPEIPEYPDTWDAKTLRQALRGTR